MSRRGKKIDPIDLAKGLAMLAAFGLISEFLQGLPEGSGTVAVRALSGVGALILVYLIARFLRGASVKPVRYELLAGKPIALLSNT
jgi:hypothetical protein